MKLATFDKLVNMTKVRFSFTTAQGRQTKKMFVDLVEWKIFLDIGADSKVSFYAGPTLSKALRPCTVTYSIINLNSNRNRSKVFFRVENFVFQPESESTTCGRSRVWDLKALRKQADGSLLFELNIQSISLPSTSVIAPAVLHHLIANQSLKESHVKELTQTRENLNVAETLLSQTLTQCESLQAELSKRPADPTSSDTRHDESDKSEAEGEIPKRGKGKGKGKRKAEDPLGGETFQDVFRRKIEFLEDKGSEDDLVCWISLLKDSIQTLSVRRDALNSCVVCLGAPRAVIILPCKHMASCETCLTAVKKSGKCPVCRGAIKSTMVPFR